MKKTKSLLDKIKNPKRTQVVIENLHLSELLDENVIKALKDKFLEKYGEPIITSIQVFLVPPEKKVKKEGKSRIESLTFEQPSAQHYKNKKVIVSSSLGDVLEIFLKNNL